MVHGGLRHREIKLLLVHAQLLGISDALEVVSQGVQDRIVHDVGGDETGWWSQVGVRLLQERIERFVNLETIYGVRDLHPSLSLREPTSTQCCAGCRHSGIAVQRTARFNPGMCVQTWSSKG